MISGQSEERSGIPSVRKRTNKSLGAERTKADDALSITQRQTERQADQSVAAGRAEVDQTLSRSSSGADHSKDVDRASAGASGMNECLDGRARLEQEQKAADKALKAERRNVDADRKEERRKKKASEEKFFQAERRKTDRDLTRERRKADAESERERDAHIATLAALTTRDEFLAIVSHDLRNPLSSALMAADFLSEKLYAGADAETRSYLDVIGRNVREALSLISDLLDMERIGLGKLNLQIDCHDIGDIVQRSVKTLLPQATAKNVSLGVGTLDVAVAVKCDRDRISQVLSNLIGNALKFTPSGGTVTLAVKRTSPDEVQVSVTDTGRGIPEDMRKRIFERFWQIGKQDRRGLGLGLYISTMIVEAHGGRIWVDSEVGRGSTFHFSLPASHDQVKPSHIK